jgi:hypothetical protein
MIIFFSSTSGALLPRFFGLNDSLPLAVVFFYSLIFIDSLGLLASGTVLIFMIITVLFMVIFRR